MLPEVKCVIIDDEPKAIHLLKERLGILFPDLAVQQSFTDWKKGIEYLKKNAIDLLFLDVSMPEKTGIDFLRLFPGFSFQVIFITAHSEFALHAIKLSAVGYVLKPIDDFELSFAVNKALSRIGGNKDTASALSATAGNSFKIGIPNVKGVDYLNADEILYFESVNKYTKVVTGQHSIISSYNLGEFKKIIDSEIFFQVHRSYIINLRHIKRYETAVVITMEDNMQIPVSKNTRADLMTMFGKISRTAGLKGKD